MDITEVLRAPMTSMSGTALVILQGFAAEMASVRYLTINGGGYYSTAVDAALACTHRAAADTP